MQMTLSSIEKDLCELGTRIARLSAHTDPARSTDTLVVEIRQDLRYIDGCLRSYEVDVGGDHDDEGGIGEGGTEMVTVERMRDQLQGARRSYRRALGAASVNIAASADRRLKRVAAAGRTRVATQTERPSTDTLKPATTEFSSTGHGRAIDSTKRLDWATQRNLLLASTKSLSTDKSNRPSAADGGEASSRGGPSTTLLQKSNAVTRALQQTHTLLSAELSKSLLSGDMLMQSSRDVASLDANYSALALLLAGSRLLVRELERANARDRLYIYAALGVFAAVVAWILYRRVIKRGLKPLVYIASFAMRSTKDAASKARAKDVVGGVLRQDRGGGGGGGEGDTTMGDVVAGVVSSVSTAILTAGAAAVSSGLAGVVKDSRIEDLKLGDDDDSVYGSDDDDAGEQPEVWHDTQDSLEERVAQRLQRAMVQDVQDADRHDEL